MFDIYFIIAKSKLLQHIIRYTVTNYKIIVFLLSLTYRNFRRDR